MKKVISVLLSVASAFCFIFVFSGCKDEEIKVSGEFYTLKEAYDNGWLVKSDVRNIAFYYYKFYKMEDPNDDIIPIDPQELSEKMQKELKLAYLERIDVIDGTIDKVDIYMNYGIYGNDIVVGIKSDYLMCDIIVEQEFDIGGVVFLDFWQGEILVYHCSEIN